LQEGVANQDLARLHVEHGAIAILLVTTPTRSVIATLKAILSVHNPLEESIGGVYETLDNLAGDETASLLEQFQNAPKVPVLPTRPLPEVIDHIKRTVAMAGYTFIEMDE